jgi:hypothetical protein
LNLLSPSEKREAVKEFMRRSSSLVKSPLSPLYQRGEPKSGFFRIADLRFFLSTSHFL